MEIIKIKLLISVLKFYKKASKSNSDLLGKIVTLLDYLIKCVDSRPTNLLTLFSKLAVSVLVKSKT